jgi:putative ABC transport system permease protein
LLALFRKRHLDRELEGEILAHLEMAEQEALAAGMEPEEARRVARMRFGGVEQVKEAHRDRRSLRWIETVLGDFRYGLASLRRNPGFALVAVGVLALGIGANAAMFSLVDAVLLKPLPFPEPERMVRVWESPRAGEINGVNAPDFQDWKRLSTVFEALSAEAPLDASLTGQGAPERIAGLRVSADYFEVFGVAAQIGRTFAPEEDQPGADPVIVLSHAAWQSRFGGDPDILGRDLVLDGEPNRVIGVLPPGSFDREEGDLWKPLVFTPADQTRGSHWFGVLGRLRRGVSLAQAREEMVAIDASLTDLSPDWKKHWSVAVEPFDQRMVGHTLRRSIQVAFGAVVMVLLIACANVANLLLARGAARRKEMAVRSALGASRGRLVGQLLTESLVLALLGGGAGIGVAHLLLAGAAPLLADSLPFTAEVGLDLRVLAFAGVVALAVTVLVGLLPSLAASFSRLALSMSQVGRGSSRSREGLRRVIVAGEVAVSLVLVCGALLLFRSLLNLQRVDPRVATENIITMSTNLPLAAYPNPERSTLFYDSVIDRVKAVPGVEEATLSTWLPLEPVREGMAILSMSYDTTIEVRYKRVGPAYLHLFGIPVLSGRGIDDRDRAGAPPAVVINEELAARMSEELGFADPVGKKVRVVTPRYVDREADLLEAGVVGVIRSELTDDAKGAHAPIVYVPLAQVPARRIKLIVRTRQEPSSVMPAIRQAVARLDPNLALGEVRTLERIKEWTLAGTSRPTWIIGAFAAVAMLLAALGLYGVLAHAVVERRREIGIRMALGARSGDVLSHVLGSAARMILVGIVLGLGGALALTRVMEGLLFQVSALDPTALAIACASVAAVGLLAGWIPARRAALVEPMVVLRDEG